MYMLGRQKNTPETLVSELSIFEVEMAMEKLKKKKITMY
jgi:hypothetical protein